MEYPVAAAAGSVGRLARVVSRVAKARARAGFIVPLDWTTHTHTHARASCHKQQRQTTRREGYRISRGGGMGEWGESRATADSPSVSFTGNGPACNAGLVPPFPHPPSLCPLNPSPPPSHKCGYFSMHSRCTFAFGTLRNKHATPTLPPFAFFEGRCC